MAKGLETGKCEEEEEENRKQKTENRKGRKENKFQLDNHHKIDVVARFFNFIEIFTAKKT